MEIIVNKKLGNSGLIRQLKKISRDNSENKKSRDNQKLIGFPSFWSFIAIVISLVSIYFQFFFVNHDLHLNLVDGFSKNDSLRYQIIYHNRGNQDATVLNSRIELFPKNKKKINSIKIYQKKIPLIISSGKQEYEEMNLPIDCSNYNLESWNFKTSDTLAVELVFEYLNDNNFRSEKRFVCGWIKFNDQQKVEYYYTELNSVDLQSERYFTNSYITEE